MPHLVAAYNLARWLVRHPQDAEDMVQEAYLKAYRSFGGYRGGDPAAWLLAIVRNTCLTWLKRQSGQHKIIDFNEALIHRSDLADVLSREARSPIEPDAALLAEADRAMVQDALHRLPEHYRVVLVLREFEELSYRQIADVVGAPVGTVMSRLSRARLKLKELLLKDEDGGRQNEL